MIRLIGLAIAAGFLLWGFASLRRNRLITDLPTSKVRGIALGLTELKGTAEIDVPLHSLLARVACVAYSWSCEAEYHRTETYTENGETKTRQVQGWETVASGGEQVPFWLRDDTGRVLVRPDGGNLEMNGVLSETGHRGDALSARFAARSTNGDTGRRRYSESAIAVGTALYVLGTAVLRDDAVEPAITKQKGDPLLISVRDESRIAKGKTWSARIAFVLGTAAAVLGGSAGGVPWAIVAGAGYLAVWFVAWLVLIYNGLVRVRTRVDSSWAMVDVELARRAALVPALQAVVEAAARHERATFESVAAARTVAASGSVAAGVDRTPSGADVREASGKAVEQTAVLRSGLVLAEAYPELTSSDVYGKLRAELVGCEDRLAFARTYFNDAVTAFQDRAGSFPGNVAVRFGKFPSAELFMAAGFERALPPVQLGS